MGRQNVITAASYFQKPQHARKSFRHAEQSQGVSEGRSVNHDFIPRARRQSFTNREQGSDLRHARQSRVKQRLHFFCGEDRSRFNQPDQRLAIVIEESAELALSIDLINGDVAALPGCDFGWTSQKARGEHIGQ